MTHPVRIIVAHDEARVIGHRGQIPWDLPADREHFAEVTQGGVVIMGRRTHDGLVAAGPSEPLPGRHQIVISARRGGSRFCLACDNLADAIRGARCSVRPIWIIGGAQVYAAALAAGVVDEVVASLVPGRHEGDAFFPALDPAGWREVAREPRQGFAVVRYARLGPPGGPA